MNVGKVCVYDGHGAKDAVARAAPAGSLVLSEFVVVTAVRATYEPGSVPHCQLV